MRMIGEDDIRYAKQHLDAADRTFQALAKFLGREDEYALFLKKREKFLNTINNETDSHANFYYEDFKQSIPYWVKALEEPLLALYEQGLKDASKPEYGWSKVRTEGSRSRTKSRKRK
jgi:hypothetical protein